MELDAVAALARTIGVHSIAREARELATQLPDTALHVQEAQRLCGRLEQYLLEERRALSRTGDEPRRHLDAITACLVIFEQVIVAMRERLAVDAIRRELAAERRKLIMGRKADLLVELSDRVLWCIAGKRDLPAIAHAVADELGRDAICCWATDLRARSDRHVAAHAEELVRRLRAACGDLADPVLTPAFASVSIRASDARPAMPAPSSYRAPALSWLVPEATVRARVTAAASEALVALLDRETERIVEWHVRYHALACEQVEASFATALDQYAQLASIANARAREAKSNGTVAQAHERLDFWLRRLEEQRQLSTGRRS